MKRKTKANILGIIQIVVWVLLMVNASSDIQFVPWIIILFNGLQTIILWSDN